MGPKRLLRKFANPLSIQDATWEFPRRSLDLLLLVDARFKAGDASAIPDYLEWIKQWTTKPGMNFYSFNYIFQPFGSHPDDPGIRKAVSEIVKAPDSIWSPTSLADSAGWFIASPLLVFPEIYDSALRALDDKEPFTSRDSDTNGKRICDLVAAQVGCTSRRAGF